MGSGRGAFPSRFSVSSEPSHLNCASAHLGPFQEKQPAWTREDWLRESEQRTRDYKAGRVKGPVSWILVEGMNIPERAIRSGEERDGNYTYICRAWYEVSRNIDISEA